MPSLRSKKFKKEDIINKAIEFFSKNGFAGTTIDDITEALGIAKGTFYLCFRSKKELLIDCIGQLANIVVPKKVWKDIRNETDYTKRQEKRLVAFLKAFPTFCGILNLLKYCIQSKDPVLVKKANDTYKMLVNPLRKDLRWAVEHGVVGRVDEEVVSFLNFGMAESAGYLLMIDPRYTLEYVTKIVMSMILSSKGGPLLQAETPAKSKTENCYWVVTDCNGLKSRLRNLCFDGKDYLCGIFGNGEFRVPVINIASMDLYREQQQVSATLSDKNGEKVTLKIDGDTSLSGESQLGQYIIPLKDVACISLAVGDDSLAETTENRSLSTFR
jgi:AcrR family transcriptional regulator